MRSPARRPPADDGRPRLDVLLVPQAYWPVIGGQEVLATAVGEGLAARGHRVAVFTPSLPGSEGFLDPAALQIDLPRSEERNGVRIERCRFPPVGERTWHALRTWPIPFRGLIRRRLRRHIRSVFPKAVAKRIRRQRPDVVLAMAHHSPNVLAVAEARRQHTFPLVYSPQLHHDQPGWRPDAVRGVVALADVLTANTDFEAGLLAAEYGADPARTVVTGCGVSGTCAIPPWPRPRRIVYVGRKATYKGLGFLIEAMRHVWAEEEDVELVLVGARIPETQEVDAILRALPAPLAAQVRDRDDVSEADKEEWLRTSTCLVLPSRHESFGIVLLEAWRFGTPVVTLDRPVARDVVRDGETGLLTDPDDPAALAAGIVRLIRDPALAERLGRAGHADVEARHTWTHVAERYERALLLARES